MAETVEERKLFVGGISSETTEETLMLYFSSFGKVVNVNVPNGNRKGFAFVTFSKTLEASLALRNPNHQILGRKVDVKRAIPRAEQRNFPSDQLTENSRPSKIFVGGLPSNLTDEEFKNHFERFGTITDIVVIRDSINNRPRGFGFVEFDSKDPADEVLKNEFHELKGKRVEVKKAIPKDGNYYRLRRHGGYGELDYYSVYPYGNYNMPYSRYICPYMFDAYGRIDYLAYQYGHPYMYATSFGGAYTVAARGGYDGIAPYVAQSPRYWGTPLYYLENQSEIFM